MVIAIRFNSFLLMKFRLCMDWYILQHSFFMWKLILNKTNCFVFTILLLRIRKWRRTWFFIFHSKYWGVRIFCIPQHYFWEFFNIFTVIQIYIVPHPLFFILGCVDLLACERKLFGLRSQFVPCVIGTLSLIRHILLIHIFKSTKPEEFCVNNHQTSLLRHQTTTKQLKSI